PVREHLKDPAAAAAGAAAEPHVNHHSVIPSPRRSTELGLILLGALITVGAYVLASIGTTASLPANVVPFLVIVLGLLVGAHMTMRWVAPQADPMLLPLAGLLNGVGSVMVARLDQKLAGL